MRRSVCLVVVALAVVVACAHVVASEHLYDVRVLAPGVSAVSPQYTAYVTFATLASPPTTIRVVPRTRSRVEHALASVVAWLRWARVRGVRAADATVSDDVCTLDELALAGAADRRASVSPGATHELTMRVAMPPMSVVRAVDDDADNDDAASLSLQCNAQLLRRMALPRAWLAASMLSSCGVVRDVFVPALPLYLLRHPAPAHADVAATAATCVAVPGWAVSELQLYTMHTSSADVAQSQQQQQWPATTLVVRLRLLSLAPPADAMTKASLRSCWLTLEAAPCAGASDKVSSSSSSSGRKGDNSNAQSTRAASRTTMFGLLAVVAVTRLLPRALAPRRHRRYGAAAAARARRLGAAGAHGRLDAQQRALLRQRIEQLLQQVKADKEKHGGSSSSDDARVVTTDVQ